MGPQSKQVGHFLNRSSKFRMRWKLLLGLIRKISGYQSLQKVPRLHWLYFLDPKWPSGQQSTWRLWPILTHNTEISLKSLTQLLQIVHLERTLTGWSTSAAWKRKSFFMSINFVKVHLIVMRKYLLCRNSKQEWFHHVLFVSYIFIHSQVLKNVRQICLFFLYIIHPSISFLNMFQTKNEQKKKKKLNQYMNTLCDCAFVGREHVRPLAERVD